MKHRFSILFFMLLLISGMCVCAQTHSYASFMMADHAMPGDPSVARHWKGDCVVASFYNNNAAKWYLGILRVHGFMSGSISYDTLCVSRTPPVFRIMDIFVVGDTTYFCGTSGRVGMYGWFPNDTVIYSSVPIHYIQVNQLDTLKRPVVHRKASDGSMHLSAIGVNSATGGQYILEAGDAAAPGMQSYSLAAVTEAEGTHEEVLDDVLLTDGHVVFVSRDRRGGVMLQRTSGSLNTCPLVQCSGCSQETVTTYEANPVTGVNAPLATKSYTENVTPTTLYLFEEQPHTYCRP